MRRSRRVSLLSETSWQAMLARHVAMHDPAEDASPVRTDGYGWFTGTASGLPVRYHPGDNPGFRALNGWIPELAGEILAAALAS